MKLWDLRKKGNVQILNAHTKLISDIKFDKEGKVMITASYDQKVKVWAMPSGVTSSDYSLPCLRTLENGHENKVTSACVTRDLKYILSTSFDRTFKLWEQNKS